MIDAPIARVWAVLRDFNSHDQWHDVVAESRIEGDERGDQVGCVRSFTLKDGNRIREQLLTLSDSDYKSTYCIVEATVPLQRYVATVTLKPVTDGDRTFWHWESTFATPPGRERELREMVARDVYEAGFENLRRHLRQGGDLRGPAGAAMPTALPLPARRAVVHRYGGPEVLQPGDGEAAAPGAGEVRIRQRAIGVNYLDVYLRKGWIPALLPLPGVPGMEAVGTVVDVGANVNGLLPGDRVAYLGQRRRAPIAACARCRPSGSCACRPTSRTTSPRRRCSRASPPTSCCATSATSAPARACSCMPPPAASACSSAPGRGASARPSSAPSRARRRRGSRASTAAPPDRDARASLRRRGAGAVRRRRRRHRRHRRRRARRELRRARRRGHWISLGQASGALQPIATDQLVQKSITFSRPAVFDYVATNASLAERAARVWAALADGTLKAPPIERHALGAAAEAHARLESRRSVAS